MRRIWKIGLVVVFGLGLAGCAWLFAPPTANCSLSASPSNPTTEDTVTFTLLATAGSGRDLQSWKFWYNYTTTGVDPDRTGMISGPTLHWSEDHTYPDAGSYTARLEVVDSEGQVVFKELPITVTPPPPKITQFKAVETTLTSNFATKGQTLTIASGGEVEFSFKANAATGTERTIKTWVLSCPGSDQITEEHDGLAVTSLTVAGIPRAYPNTESQTRSYTTTVRVYDDIGNFDTATITIEVGPAASP